MKLTNKVVAWIFKTTGIMSVKEHEAQLEALRTFWTNQFYSMWYDVDRKLRIIAQYEESKTFDLTAVLFPKEKTNGKAENGSEETPAKQEGTTEGAGAVTTG